MVSAPSPFIACSVCARSGRSIGAPPRAGMLVIEWKVSNLQSSPFTLSGAGALLARFGSWDFFLSSLYHLGGWRENSTDALVALIVRRLGLAILCLNNDATFFRLDGRERFGRYTTQCATLLSLPSNCAKIKGNKYARYQGSIPNKMWHHKLKLPAKDIKH